MKQISVPQPSRAEWAIVLAGGDGTRLRGLTVDGRSAAVPKQYCSLRGGRSLLWDAIERARSVVPAEHVVVVVAKQHEAWWRREIAEYPRENVFVQPENRGTAAGILLPLLGILERDPEARVALFPSDHFVREEQVLARAVRTAMAALRGEELVLFGITPEYAETEYGWVVPVPGGRGRVAAFVEKPRRLKAQACRSLGGVWNSFLLSAKCQALLELYERRAPILVAAFRATRLSDERALAGLYASLDTVDFSRAVLEGSEPFLSLHVVPACGWTDLGTPERVARCLRGLRHSWAPPAGARAALDLSWALERLRAQDDQRPAMARCFDRALTLDALADTGGQDEQ